MADILERISKLKEGMSTEHSRASANAKDLDGLGVVVSQRIDGERKKERYNAVKPHTHTVKTHRRLIRSVFSGSFTIHHLYLHFSLRTDITQQLEEEGKPRKDHQIPQNAYYPILRSDITRTKEATRYLGS
jgi:hypothetical protein